MRRSDVHTPVRSVEDEGKRDESQDAEDVPHRRRRSDIDEILKRLQDKPHRYHSEDCKDHYEQEAVLHLDRRHQTDPLITGRRLKSQQKYPWNQGPATKAFDHHVEDVHERADEGDLHGRSYRHERDDPFNHLPEGPG